MYSRSRIQDVLDFMMGLAINDGEFLIKKVEAIAILIYYIITV